MNEKEQFISAHIERINKTHASAFIADEIKKGGCPFNSWTSLQTYLKEKMLTGIRDSKISLAPVLWKDFEKNGFIKSKIPKIANNYRLFKNDVEELLIREAKQKLLGKYIAEDFSSLLDAILAHLDTQENRAIGYSSIKSEIKSAIKGSLYMSLQGGFPVNLQEINLGIMTSNAGDSAQFLFIARAILAGFNCSNVDVRSSRYDVVIDYKNTLIRIQVKGISASSSISFFDRPRGGQGNDHTHESNVGKRITGKDCDFYAAVDKRCGICYLIPLTYADRLSEESARSVRLDELTIYRENWSIFEEFIKKAVMKGKNALAKSPSKKASISLGRRKSIQARKKRS